MSMSIFFSFFSLFFGIGIIAALFTIGYFIIKLAVKNGILEAHHEIHKMNQND